MNYNDFQTKAVKYLPKIHLSTNPISITLIVLENISFKEDLAKLLPKDSESIIKFLAMSPSFEGKAGQSGYAIVGKSNI